MKTFISFLSFFFLSLSLTGQCSSLVLGSNGLPSETPDNLECIEAANRIIAEHYAPVIYHMTDMSSNRSVGGRADLITSVFYDVDLNNINTQSDLSTGNNWANLENYSSGQTENIDALDPYVYYSVVWTDDYWIIAYGYYHPRDWAGGGACCGTPFTPSDSHENDYEASIFVINRNDYNLKGTFTTFHKKFLKYSTTEIDLTNNPNVFIDDRTHGPVMNLTSGECIEDGGNPCDGCKFFFLNNSNLQVIYRLSEDGVAFVNATIGIGDRLVGEGEYILEDIFGSHEYSKLLYTL